mgnify:CR=1 FL=1
MAVEPLVISSSPENIRNVESFIDTVCTTFDVGEEAYGNMLISVTEAANNAIIHGNGRDASKKVTLTADKDESGKYLVITVSDEGDGFDFHDLPDPTAPENITAVGGRGIFLIQQLADLVVFDNDGSTVEIQFKL